MLSSPFARLSAQARRRLSALTTAALTCALAAGAWLYPGISQTDLDLNDGGVWVTSTQQHLVGRVNYPSRQIDSALRTASSRFDVTQNQQQVLVPDLDAASVAAIDPVMVQMGSPTSLSPTARVAQGADRVIVFDPAEGRVHASQTDDFVSLPFTEPLIDNLPDVSAAVGQDGSVHAVSSTGELVTAPVGTQGWKALRRQQLSLSQGGDLAVTAVGTSTVVLESGTGVVHLPSGATTDLGGAGMVLQQPGPQASYVLVASRTNLLAVPLDGSAPREVVAADQLSGAEGVAVQPVLLEGCVYGAWSSSGQFVKQCGSEAPEVRVDSSLASASNPVFRVNRSAIVLNDTINGNVWLPEDNLVLVDDWVDATAQTDADADKQDKSAQTTDSKKTRPDRTEENHAPVAVDDTFGVRPGRSTVLPVLANDVDSDGDILTAVSGYSGSLGTVSTSQAGRALQLSVPGEATGTLAIPYTASDGRGLSDSAVATVSIHGWDVNGAPEPSEPPTLSLASGGSVSAYVLDGWQDPDGDPIFLVSASGEDVEARTTQEGTLTVQDTGSGTGTRKVEIIVSDGTETTAGTVFVEVVSAEEAAPITNADHVRVVAGATVTVSPLDNDISPTGEPLKLSQLQEAPVGAQVEADRRAGTFTFTSDVPQTYYLEYGASGGSALATSVVRVDVLEKSEPSVPPVVEDDTALLRDGSSVTLAPLSNDFDQAGGVLVLQEVSAPSEPSVSVTIVDHAYLKVSAADVVPAGLSLTYTVSNGTTSATGTVSIVRATQDEAQPPVANADSAVVRSGDVVTIPVLDNDYSPSHLQLRLGPGLSTVGESLGTAWVSDKDIRFKAGDVADHTTLTYTVLDERGQSATGTVSLEVRARSEETNTAPHPASLEAQTLAGQPVRVSVPLDGIDPDGDSVTLTGLDQTPTMGSVKVEATWLVYTPADGLTGTDTFTYTVEDSSGAKATASVRVGVAPAAETNSAPVAVDDVVTAKPGRTVSVDPVSNDLDADGDSLHLAEDPVADDAETNVRVRAGRVLVDLPDQEGLHSLRYTVTDSRGGYDTGTVTFQVLSSAPLLAPVGVDDYASPDNVEADGTVVVPVLDNDRDEDGNPWELSVSTNDPAAVVVDDKIRVTLQAEPRLVLYTITDADGLSGNAVIRVPGVTRTPPRMNLSTIPVHIPQDTDTTVSLPEHVITRAGTSPTLVERTTPRVSPGLASASPQAGGASLVLAPQQGFSGTTSVTFEVTDGASDNPATATLTMPVVVDASTNSAPVFTPTQLSVTAGGPAITVDLASMTRDTDPGDLATMSYTVGNAPTGFSVSQAGSQLTVSSPQDTPDGTQGVLSVTVSDGKSNPVTGSVPLRAVSQDHPLPTVLPSSLTSTGQPVTVDVTSLVSSPVPGSQISLVGPPSVSSGLGSASASGTSLTISPDAGFYGRIVVAYRATDSPQKADRTVSGSVTVAVTGAPGRPVAVRAAAVSETAIQVSWRPGADNGSQVTGYTLSEVGGAGSWSCPASPCQATGLAPGGTYSFRVVAHSAAGDSAPSAASAPVPLTVRPRTPATPNLQGGLSRLTASWPAVPAVSGGVRYQVTLTPEVTGAQSVTVETGETSTVFQAGQITVGVPYHVTVQAKPLSPNGEDSGVSAPSNSASAYAAPGQPGTPSGSFDSGNRLNVHWSPAAPNGAPVSYTVSINGPGLSTTYDTGPRTSTQISDVGRGDYTLTVTATNAGGTATSEAWTVNHTTNPLPPSVPALTSYQVREELTVSSPSTAVSGNGWSSAELSIEYELAEVGSTGNPWVVQPNGNGSLTGLINGKRYVLRARAVGADGTSSQPSGWSAPAMPASRPQEGQVDCHVSGRDVVCYWRADLHTGLPTSYTVTSNDETISSEPSGTTTKSFPDSEGSLEVCVKATNSLGTNQKCGIRRIQAPEPAVPVGTSRTFSTLVNAPDAHCTQEDLNATGYSPEHCRRLVIDIEGFNPNSTLSCAYEYRDTADGRLKPYRTSVQLDANGAGHKRFPHRIDLSERDGFNKITCTQQ